jgi:hypothetical protein
MVPQTRQGVARSHSNIKKIGQKVLRIVYHGCDLKTYAAGFGWARVTQVGEGN